MGKGWPLLQVVTLMSLGITGEEAGLDQARFRPDSELETLVIHLKGGPGRQVWNSRDI